MKETYYTLNLKCNNRWVEIDRYYSLKDLRAGAKEFRAKYAINETPEIMGLRETKTYTTSDVNL